MTVKKVKKNSVLITPDNSPDVIEAVKNELQKQEAKLILTKLLDLEKAIYHIAAKQQQLSEKFKELEASVVVLSTHLEEIMNGMDTSFDETSDDETLIDWENKKKIVSSTNN